MLLTFCAVKRTDIENERVNLRSAQLGFPSRHRGSLNAVGDGGGDSRVRMPLLPLRAGEIGRVDRRISFPVQAVAH